eukprot:8295879-Alexandrium_andersonii.AAC.1
MSSFASCALFPGTARCFLGGLAAEAPSTAARWSTSLKFELELSGKVGGEVPLRTRVIKQHGATDLAHMRKSALD